MLSKATLYNMIKEKSCHNCIYKRDRYIRQSCYVWRFRKTRSGFGCSKFKENRFRSTSTCPEFKKK